MSAEPHGSVCADVKTGLGWLNSCNSADALNLEDLPELACFNPELSHMRNDAL
ncbi:MAG: hypothetical protein VX608_02730 [Chloroflexota bacterium]|nr:hypothetical protein [Chloroflexota bacterium]